MKNTFELQIKELLNLSKLNEYKENQESSKTTSMLETLETKKTEAICCRDGINKKLTFFKNKLKSAKNLIKDLETKIADLTKNTQSTQENMKSTFDKQYKRLIAASKDNPEVELAIENLIRESSALIQCTACSALPSSQDTLFYQCKVKHRYCWKCVKKESKCLKDCSKTSKICFTPYLEAKLKELHTLRQILKELNSELISKKKPEYLVQTDFLSSAKTFEGDSPELLGLKRTNMPVICSFKTSLGGIIEFTESMGKIVPLERKRLLEDKYFLFSFGDLQLNAEFKEFYWIFTLKEGNSLLDEIRIEGSNFKKDRFIKKRNQVYFSVYKGGELHRIVVNDDLLRVEEVGCTNKVAQTVLEREDTVFAGVQGGIFKMREKKSWLIAKMSGSVEQLRLEGDLLWAVDSAGLVVAVDILSHHRMHQWTTGAEGTHLFSGSKVVRWLPENITIFDKKGEFQDIITNSVDLKVKIVLNNTKFAALTAKKALIVWNHDKLSFQEYSLNGSLERYASRGCQ